MRARDLRAIAFCIVTSIMVLVAVYMLIWSYPLALMATAAYDALILTRPRMLRVFRRLRGEPDWGGYYRD